MRIHKIALVEAKECIVANRRSFFICFFFLPEAKGEKIICETQVLIRTGYQHLNVSMVFRLDEPYCIIRSRKSVRDMA